MNRSRLRMTELASALAPTRKPGLPMLVALTAVFACWSNVDGDELATRIQQLKTDGSPISIADLKPAAVKDDANGAAILNQSWPALVEFEKSIYEYNENVLMAGVDDKMIELHDRLIKKHPKLFGQLQLASQATVYQAALPYDNTAPADFLKQVTKQTNRFRSACRILTFRARVLAAKGDGKAAAESALQMIAISRHADRQPMLVAQTVAEVCHRMSILTLGYVLQHVAIPDSKRREIEKVLAKYESSSLLGTIVSERAFGLTQSKHYSERIQLDYLNYCEMQIANADKTLPQYEKQLKKMDEDALKQMLRHPLIALLDPAYSLVRNSKTRNLGLARCVRILNRLQVKKVDAEKVDLVSLGFMKLVTADPYNDQSIQIERFKTGWRVSFSGGLIRPPDDTSANKKE